MGSIMGFARDIWWNTSISLETASIKWNTKFDLLVSTLKMRTSSSLTTETRRVAIWLVRVLSVQYVFFVCDFVFRASIFGISSPTGEKGACRPAWPDIRHWGRSSLGDIFHDIWTMFSASRPSSRFWKRTTLKQETHARWASDYSCVSFLPTPSVELSAMGAFWKLSCSVYSRF